MVMWYRLMEDKVSCSEIFGSCLLLVMVTCGFLSLPVQATGAISFEVSEATIATPSSPLPIAGHRFLSRLRRGACLLYQSAPLGLVISRLEVS